MDENEGMGPDEFLSYMDAQILSYRAVCAEQRALAQSTKNLLGVWSTAHQTMLKDAARFSQAYAPGLMAGAAPGKAMAPGQMAGGFDKTAQAARGMTRETFEEWIAYARRASEATRTMFSASISAIGDGIATQLVDGTYEWRDAWKAVLRQVIATAAEIAIVQGLMALLTGGASGAAKGAGALGGIFGGLFHTGGTVPRRHLGVLARDEHLAVLQRGEYVVRRSSAQAIGGETLDRMNRTGQVPAGPTFHVNVSVQAGGASNPRQLAEQIAEPLIQILRRESARNRKIL
jgi:hypothetical protein